MKKDGPVLWQNLCKIKIGQALARLSVVIKLLVLSDLSDICTFGPILKALLQDQMSDRSLKSLPYKIYHKILNIAPTGKYDLSMDLSHCVEYEFSMYYCIALETLP